MECHQIMCHNEAVAVLEVKYLLNGRIYDFEYGYCEHDLPWFKEKFESKPEFTVTERKL